MKRLDHLLFQADTDFIAYFDTLPVPNGENSYHHLSEQFARFIARQAQARNDLRRAMNAVEAIMVDGGWNAEQLRLQFYPTLNRELKDAAARASLETGFGLNSQAEWARLQRDRPERVNII